MFERTLGDLVVKMDTLQDQAIKHARMTNETLAKEVTRIEKVMGTLESFSKLQVSELRKDITAVKQETDRWTVNFEDMQARKIMEIHQAIKVLNSNATYIQKDAIERFELLQGQSANNTSMLTTQIKDIKQYFKSNTGSKVPEEDPNKQVISLLLQQQQQQRANSTIDSKDVDEKLKKLKQECETRASEIAYAQVRKVLAEREHSDILIEGRAN